MTKSGKPTREDLLRAVFEEQHKQHSLVRRSHGHSPHDPPPAVRQNHLLRVLEDCPGIRQKDLAERMHVRPQSLGELLDKLEDSGLVVRRKDPEDGRAVRVELTEDGRAAEREHRKNMAENIRKRFGALTDDELQEYLRLTKKINDSLDKQENL